MSVVDDVCVAVIKKNREILSKQFESPDFVIYVGYDTFNELYCDEKSKGLLEIRNAGEIYFKGMRLYRTEEGHGIKVYPVE